MNAVCRFLNPIRSKPVTGHETGFGGIFYSKKVPGGFKPLQIKTIPPKVLKLLAIYSGFGYLITRKVAYGSTKMCRLKCRLYFDISFFFRDVILTAKKTTG
jgi:hypothetical protein